MELSPRARERLARIGDLSAGEKEKLAQSGELDFALSQYFKGGLTLEDLWKRLKSLKDKSTESIVKEAQLKLADTISLAMDKADFEQRRHAILALETMKEKGTYSALELVLNSIETVRQKYTQLKERAYQQFKVALEGALQGAGRKAIREGVNLDMKGSVEATIKNSAQWREFLSKHEETSAEVFNSHIAKLRKSI